MSERSIILAFHFMCFWIPVLAQPDCDFSLGDDINACQGEVIVLSAPAGLSDLLWSTGETSPSITVDSPGAYWLTAGSGAAGSELVTNGDLSGGATGFSSEYSLSTTVGPYGLLSDQGQYVVMTDPQDAHYDFASCGDHTSGTGNMMVVNGADVPGVAIWCQTVPVDPNTDYSFSAWLMTVFPSDPAILEFTINGSSIGSPLLANATPCIWEPYAASWYSGTETSAEICIVNQNTSIFGNDLALDDISFTTICTHTDTIEVDFGDQLTVDLGPDTVICEGTSLVLEVNIPNVQITWNDGSNSLVHTVTEAGDHWVIVEQGGCVGSDSIQVGVEAAPLVEIAGDTVLCDPDGTVLTANTTGSPITWQDGTSAPDLIAMQPGIYSVTVGADGCLSTDQVEVVGGEPPWIEVQGDTVLCEQQDVVLFAIGPDPSQITWPDGTTGGTWTASTPGIFHAAIANGCGIAADSAVVRLARFDPPDTFFICPGGTSSVSFRTIANSIMWYDGSNSLEMEFPEGDHAYELIDTAGCARSGSIEVIVDPEADDLVLAPNSFSPNGDGINDAFFIAGADREDFHLQIFDRWGERIFSSDDPAASWTGELNGTAVPNGVYPYVLEYRRTCESTGQDKILGHVTVIR